MSDRKKIAAFFFFLGTFSFSSLSVQFIQFFPHFLSFLSFSQPFYFCVILSLFVKFSCVCYFSVIFGTIVVWMCECVYACACCQLLILGAYKIGYSGFYGINVGICFDRVWWVVFFTFPVFISLLKHIHRQVCKKIQREN